MTWLTNAAKILLKFKHYIALTNGADGIINETSFWARALEENEIQEMMDVSLDVEAIGKLAVTWVN